jgi:CubicO group peptidase (beta-lactamase class C family)
VPQAKTITIRHLINHTSGLPDLSLDEVNDLEEVIKPFLSTAKVGEYAYNQTGYSLCGKIMEVITGKSYGLLLKEWLIVPMELTGTEVTGAASDAWSVPMDLAKIGQMLMNGGTYKNVQYFSKETYQNEMFPTEKNLQVGIGLVKTLATEATNYCGKATEEGELGTPGITVTADKDITYTREQLEKIAVENNLGFGNLVGHPAISGSLFCMDVDNKLLMIVTRNSRGKDFMNHHKEFMQTIINNVKAN